MTQFFTEKVEQIAWILSQIDIGEGYRTICRQAFRSSPEFARDYQKLESIECRMDERDPILALEKWQNTTETIDAVLELPPEEREAAVRVGDNKEFHTAAFIWRLLDREADLRFEDREASAHFARLAHAAADGWITAEGLRFGHRHASSATDLYALTAAVLGNHARIGNDLQKASALLATAEGYLRPDSDPRVAGEVFSFKGSLLDNKGHYGSCRSTLALAARRLKGVDEVRRCEVLIQKGYSLFSSAIDPDRLLVAVISALEHLPLRPSRTIDVARLNLLFFRLYLGREGDELRELLQQIPPFDEPILELSRLQAEALVTGVLGDLEGAKANLYSIAEEFLATGLTTHAAVTLTHYASACLDSGDLESAERAALEAFSSLSRSGFRDRAIEEAAEIVRKAASRKQLTIAALERLTWTLVCPNAKPDEIAWPGVQLKATA